MLTTPFRTKNNPVLISEPGVARPPSQKVSRDVSASLFCRLYSLDVGALMTGAKYHGEYEERVKSHLNEVEKAAEDGRPDAILFIDEMYLLMSGQGGEGGCMDAGRFYPMSPRLR